MRHTGLFVAALLLKALVTSVVGGASDPLPSTSVPHGAAGASAADASNGVTDIRR